MPAKGRVSVILAVITVWALILLAVITLFLLKGGRWILLQINAQFGLESIAAFSLVLYLAAGLLLALAAVGIIAFIASIYSEKKIRKLEKLYGQARQTIEGQSQDMSLIANVGESLSSVLNKAKLIRLILENFIKFAKMKEESTTGFILVYQYETAEFVYESGFGIDNTMLTKLRFSPSDEDVSQAVRTKQILVMEDAASGSAFFKKERHPFLGKGASLFLIPLIVENNVTGIVCLVSCGSLGSLVNNQSQLFLTLTKEASIALGSAMQSELAIIDRLTRFYNQSYFFRSLKQEIERCRRYKLNLSLLMIDIDHFKMVNDTYGHQQGDIVLATVAKVIKETSRMVDFCARYGGEEFAVMLPETSLYNSELSPEELKQTPLEKMGEAVTKAERLRRTVEAYEIPGYKEGTKIKITISIGIGIRKYSDEHIGPMELIKQADEHLYRAKESGRNKVCFPLAI